VVGDGGGMMRLVELWTAVRLKLRFVVVVLNDACDGMEYHTLSTHGVDPKYSLCDWPEFADVARPLGVRAYTVRNLGELECLREELAEVEGPILIDIKADSAVDIAAARQSRHAD
jgi:thiamine pyrophosphate-dependent acetolactate synthase large subunit-like protein